MTQRNPIPPFRSPPEQRRRFYLAARATQRMQRLLCGISIVCLAVYLLAVT